MTFGIARRLSMAAWRGFILLEVRGFKVLLRVEMHGLACFKTMRALEVAYVYPKNSKVRH